MALPALTITFAAEEFSVGEEAFGHVLAAYIVGMALASVPAGLAADRYGPGRMLAAFFWVMAVAAGACALATDYASLLGAHALLGVAAGLFHPAGLSIVSLTTPAAGLGPAMGLFGVFGGVGWFTAPLLMRTALGWRAGFQGLAVASVVGAIVCHLLMARGSVLAGPARAGDDGETDGAATPEAGGASRPRLRSLATPRGLLLVLLLAMGVNAFLLDGFLALYPETVGQLGARLAEEQTLVAAVMGLGAVGQYVGGLLARDAFASSRYAVLIVLQALTLFSLAQALDRPLFPLLLMGSFAFMNFMTQPIENKLLAGFTSASRRSLAYALKFVVALVVALPAPLLVTSLYARPEWGFPHLYRLLSLVGMVGVFAGIFYLRGSNRMLVRRPR